MIIKSNFNSKKILIQKVSNFDSLAEAIDSTMGAMYNTGFISAKVDPVTFDVEITYEIEDLPINNPLPHLNQSEAIYITPENITASKELLDKYLNS